MRSSASCYVFYIDSTFSSGEPQFQELSSHLWDKTAPDDTHLPNLPPMCWALPSCENLAAALNLVFVTKSELLSFQTVLSVPLGC